jgi:lactoylglutathione lyase
MNYGYTILYVAQLDATVDFYEKAFGFKRRFQEGGYAELETGATRLAFTQQDFAATLHAAPIERALPTGAAPPVELAFVTPDVDAAWKRAVAAGASPLKPPAAKPWVQVVAYVRDLNGFLVELCSPMS